MAKDSGFDRDFGYLMPFLDKLSSASEGLSPESRAELERLLSGEKEKWQRIRSVLAGVSAPAAGPAPSQPAKTAAAPRGPAPIAQSGFTVGSLRRS